MQLDDNRTGIEKHWLEAQDEKLRAFAKFAELSDNLVDRLILRALGVCPGPRPIEHDRNLPEGM